MQRLRVVDSHTGGEPTRVVLPGQVALAGRTMAERRDDFVARWDWLRSSLCNEPRGSEVWVGALLTEPTEPDSQAGVLFFNNVGMLGMCGHGTIGVVETLHHLGETAPGGISLDTPVGRVRAERHLDGRVSFENVPSRRWLANVELEVPGVGRVRGDVSYGGNWFFLVWEPRFLIELARHRELSQISSEIRRALAQSGVTGEGGAEIDHVELFGKEAPLGADSISFVQCPGGAFDRSPCGTGTSAKLACLYADGHLGEGASYRQMSVTGSVFEGSVKNLGPSTENAESWVQPTLTGRAWITAESVLFFAEDDPFRSGLCL